MRLFRNKSQLLSATLLQLKEKLCYAIICKERTISRCKSESGISAHRELATPLDPDPRKLSLWSEVGAPQTILPRSWCWLRRFLSNGGSRMAPLRSRCGIPITANPGLSLLATTWCIGKDAPQARRYARKVQTFFFFLFFFFFLSVLTSFQYLWSWNLTAHYVFHLLSYFLGSDSPPNAPSKISCPNQILLILFESLLKSIFLEPIALLNANQKTCL